MGSAGKQSVDEPGGPGSGHTPDGSSGLVSGLRFPWLEEFEIFFVVQRIQFSTAKLESGGVAALNHRLMA